MMKSRISRRSFLASGAKAGMTCGLLAASPGLLSLNLGEDEVPDPVSLNYCGYKCPADCKFLEATLKNDPALKKEAYETWQIKDRYGTEYDPETAVCYGCKVYDKGQGVVVSNCSVRDCAMDREFECCIECKELPECDKDLWTRYPEFHKAVIDMQVQFNSVKT